MNNDQIKAEDIHQELLKVNLPLIPVLEVEANMQIDCEGKPLQHYIDVIKPDFLAYRVETAKTLIDDGSYAFGFSPNSDVHGTFIVKNRESHEAYERSNPTKDLLLIDMYNSPLTRVGKVEIGMCKDGVVFGLEVKDEWFKLLEKIVKAVELDKLTNANTKSK